MKKLASYVKKKKKGGAILEFMIILPIFMIMMWLTIQFTLYIVSVNQTHQAAIEAAKSVSTYMRGTTQTTDPNAAYTDLTDDIKKSVNRTLSNNGYIQLKKVSYSIDYRTRGSACTPTNVAVNTVCVSGSDNDFTVIVKTNFVIQGLDDIYGPAKNLELTGVGVVQRELANRFRYN